MKLVFLVVFGLALRYNFAECNASGLISLTPKTKCLKYPSVAKTDQGRILGGQTAKKSYPYQVSLEDPQGEWFGFVSSWHHYCGGSIITAQHVLTAG